MTGRVFVVAHVAGAAPNRHLKLGAEIGGGARCVDAGSLQRAPKSPPDASWTDPFSGNPIRCHGDPKIPIPPKGRLESNSIRWTVPSSRFPALWRATRRPRSAKPFHPRASRPVARSVSALPGSSARDPKAPLRQTVPPEGFPARGPSVFPCPDPLGPPPESAFPLGPIHRMASRPAGLSVFSLPGPMGEGPKASDPPNLSTRRLPGRPNPSTRGLPDPMEPDPKTEFHDAMVRQNSKGNNR
jgi:hypothetical protein